MSERDEPRRNGAPAAEQPIELRRYLAALRRSRWQLLFFVLLTTAAVLAISLYLRPTYQSEATIVREEVTGLLGSGDAATVERDLETIGRLITTPRILERAGARIGRDWETFRDDVSASVSSDANIISVVATAHDAESAALLANAVANAFLAAQRDEESDRIRAARANLDAELQRLRTEGGSELEVEAIRSRLSDLTVREAAIGSDLQLAQAAQPPERPSSPRPIRNTILALFAATFVGVIGALIRDQLVPRVGSPRELARILDVPLIGGIPLVRHFRRRGVADAAEYEAYQTLQAAIRFQLPATKQHIVLVTSAVAGEGKTTVTANLGRALARAGERTLLISGDLRRPKLHEVMDVRQQPGLSELLASADDDNPEQPQRIGRMLNAKGTLAVIPTGAPPADASRALLGPGLERLIEQIKRANYTYVLIDSPPLLGIADSQVLARFADAVLIVGRPERVTLENVIELRDVLDRLGIEPLGLVAVGAKREASYYYGRGVSVSA